MALIQPNYLDCVVAIGYHEKIDFEGIEPLEVKKWKGTGFLYGVKAKYLDNSQYTTYLVTNRHVFEDLSEIIIKISPISSESIEIPFKLVIEDDKFWTGHPDEDIDIAVIPINMDLLRDKNPNADFFIGDYSLKIDEMKSNGIMEGDFIYVLGFPINIIKDQPESIIVRNGSIAQIRNLFNSIYNEFLIDAFIFPGNSGGPVILRPQTNSLDKTSDYPFSSLIGIVHSYHSYIDEAMSPQTLEHKVTFTENCGISSVYPVDLIDETIKAHDLRTSEVYKRVLDRVEEISDIVDLEDYIEKKNSEIKLKIEEDISEYTSDKLLESIKEIFEDKKIKESLMKEEIEKLRKELEFAKDFLEDKHVTRFLMNEDVEKVKLLIDEYQEKFNYKKRYGRKLNETETRNYQNKYDSLIQLSLSSTPSNYKFDA